MIRTDKLHQWAPTQMAADTPAHLKGCWYGPHIVRAEPGQVLDDEQIEAAHAATDIGADELQRRPCLPGSAEQGQRVLIGGAVVLLAVIGLVHLAGRVFG